MATEKEVQYDVDGFDAVTPALRSLINQYPGLQEGEEITFSTLSKDRGKAMFPISGAIIETEKTYVTGRVKQICLYPFYVVYRAKDIPENRKAGVKEWLDDLGRWLEQQPISIDGTEYKLAQYPELSPPRKFLSIARQTPAYLDSTTEDHTEDWAIYISARYQNEYHK